MAERFHGIDRHKKHSTISVLNREGQKVDFVSKCTDLRSYIEQLGPEDAVVLEASTGTFFWADLVESRGASCYVVPDRKVLNFLAGNALDPLCDGEVWRDVVEFLRPNH